MRVMGEQILENGTRVGRADVLNIGPRECPKSQCYTSENGYLQKNSIGSLMTPEYPPANSLIISKTT